MIRVTVPAAGTGRRSQPRVPHRLNAGSRPQTAPGPQPSGADAPTRTSPPYAADTFADRASPDRTDRIPRRPL
jgi:hypothetical protein